MKKHSTFIFKEDEIRAQKIMDRVVDPSPIGETAPFIAGTGVYITIHRSDFAINRNWYFDVMMREDGPSESVIICDGTDLLPDKIAQLVQMNGWFCVAIKRLQENDKMVISLAIYYEDKAIIRLDEDIAPVGTFSEIYIEDDAYLAYYNYHNLVIGDDDSYECSIVNTDNGDILTYLDESGTDFLCQCLVYYAMP